MRTSPRAWLAAVAATFAFASPAGALVIGGFESGLDGFTTVGDAYRVDDGFGTGMPEGSWGLFLSTFTNGDGLLGPLTGDPIEQTGTPAVATSVLESFLGLAAGTLDAISPSNPTVEGSAAQLTFTTTAVTTLRLEYVLLTNETDAWAPDFTDFFFTTLTGEGAVEQANVRDEALFSSGTVFDRDTGWLFVEWADLPAGTYTLGIGLVDVQDSDLGTALIVDNVEIIPEARTATLLSLGLGGMWLTGRPRRRR